MNSFPLSMMGHRRVGRSDLFVSPLALGGNVFGWTVDEPTSFQLLDRFFEQNGNFVDTADVYSTWVPGNRGGESETIIGRWMKLRGNRDKLIIATKVGMRMGPNDEGLSAAYIQRAVNQSLRRLQTDYIDLYQAHADDPGTPLEETLEAFARLIRQGKVLAIGASSYSPQRLAEALAISARQDRPRYECLQPLYNLYNRIEFEGGLQPLCVREELGVITFFSLANGFLTGKYRSSADFAKSERGNRIGKYLNERGLRILAALDQISERYESTPARVSLAWLIAQSGVTAAIASATSLEQLDDLVAATRLQLDSDALQALEHASNGQAKVLG